MSEGEISYKKIRGQCDICSRMGWVLIQYLDGTVVASYCKACQPKEME